MEFPSQELRRLTMALYPCVVTVGVGSESVKAILLAPVAALSTLAENTAVESPADIVWGTFGERSSRSDGPIE